MASGGYMKQRIQFKDFEGSEATREFITQQLSEHLEKFESNKEFYSSVIMSTARSRNNSHKPIFECEIVLHKNGNKSPIIVKKTDLNFHNAIRNAMVAAEKVLRRSAKIRVTRRRHPTHKLDLANLTFEAA